MNTNQTLELEVKVARQAAELTKLNIVLERHARRAERMKKARKDFRYHLVDTVVTLQDAHRRLRNALQRGRRLNGGFFCNLLVISDVLSALEEAEKATLLFQSDPTRKPE